nr:MAG TPA: hypothetical protein [Caudoviricetes sp.]
MNSDHFYKLMYIFDDLRCTYIFFVLMLMVM